MFTKIFEQHIPISEALENKLSAITQKRKFLKNEVLLKQGEVGKYLYCIESGIVRAFHTQKGKEISLYFVVEGQIFTSAYSLISQRPSFENIAALEDSILYCILRKDLYELYDTFPEMNIVGRELIELYFLELEERLNTMQFQNAKQRYKNFLNIESHLLERVSLGHLASYLGMTQETLSRIRKQEKNKKTLL
jgi:CRP/FNR family transcriptional regulator, anaerobic regulatory protein